MNKWIFGGAAGMIAICAFVIVAGILNLGPLVKHAINFYGPAITMTDVRVGDVSIALRLGRATVHEFYLGSPKGFASRETVKVKSFFIDLDEKTVAEPLVIINRVVIDRPEVTYEKLEATDNFKTILDNIMQKIGADNLQERGVATPASSAKKMLIKELVIRNGTVRLVTPLLGSRQISVPLPNIEMKDVGQIEGGASPEEVCSQVLSGLYGKITGSAVTGALNQQLKGCGLDMETAGQGAARGARDVTEKVKGLLRGQP